MRFLIIFIFSTLFLIQPSRANVVGVDAQNFNPTTSGLDFVTVQSSKTLTPGVLNLGLFFNYAINTLPNYEDATTNSRTDITDALTSMDLNMGIGLMKNWDMGISIPQAISQSVEDDPNVSHGQFENTGINEIRLNTKYRVWDGTTQGIALIASVNFFMIEDYPFTGTDAGPTYNLEAAYDTTINNFTWGLNVGYRIRDPGTPIPGLPEPFPNQYLASAAGSYYFTDWDFKVIAEIFSAIPAESVDRFSDRDTSSAEFLLGGKYDISTNFAAHMGMGTELFQGTSSPDWRIYAGVNFAIGPLFAKNETPQPSEYVDVTTEEEYSDTSFTYIDDPKAFDEPSPKNEETFMAKNILFEFNGTGVNPEFNQYLQNLAEYLLKGNVFTELVIIGHTDSVGSDAYNHKLSLKRAQSVVAIVKSYLPPEHHHKLRADGEGERAPIASNSNYQGRALNRRVEFFIKR